MLSASDSAVRTSLMTDLGKRSTICLQAGAWARAAAVSLYKVEALVSNYLIRQIIPIDV